MLREARGRVDDWPLDHDSFEALRDGLERTYRRGRRDFRAARADPSVEALHEWRKRVKELWYHHTLLRPIWPPVMQAVGDEAHELADRLGDDHDLAMLADWVARAHRRGFGVLRGRGPAPRRAAGRRDDAGGAALRRQAGRVRAPPAPPLEGRADIC